MAELITKEFLFKGDGEIDQLTQIFATLGNATESTWPGVSQLPNYMEFDVPPGRSLDEVVEGETEAFIDLLKSLV